MGERPSAANQLFALSSLRGAAQAWGSSFDGKKLVIMTKHRYTPVGKRSGKGSSSVTKAAMPDW
jgi:hypothetical protein